MQNADANSSQTDFITGVAKSGLFCNSYLRCLFGRMNSLISSGAIPLISLNIPHAKKRKFRLWTETEQSFSRNLQKVNFLSLQIIRKHLS